MPECLQSVQWSDDIVVLDSFSSDHTVKIAEDIGARVVQRRFDNWSTHQNWALQHISFKHPWVFYLDADERMPEELKNELLAIANDSSRLPVAYYCGHKNMFMGRWIRHAFPPRTIMRFMRPPSVRFERVVHPVPVINGPHGYLTCMLTHFNFSKGISEWIDKHNRYSSSEAQEGIKLIHQPSGDQPSLFSADRALRRRALKNLSFRMPWRPLLKFLYLYVWQRGCLDGRAGFTYCVLQSFYEYLIVLKMRELKRREQGLPT